MESILHDMSWVPPLRTETLTLIFNAFTFLGYTPFFLAFLPFGYWICDKAMFTRLAILVGIVGLSNTFLKDLFQDPRPPIEFALDQRVGDSFGFPSGHAQIAVAMWLWLAYELKALWAWAAAIIIAAGVVASRLYLGVHDVEDVLGGALIGLATIVIYAGLVSDQFAFWHRLNPLIQLAVIALTSWAIIRLWPVQPPSSGAFALCTLIFAWWLGHNIQVAFIGQRRHANILVSLISSAVGVALLFFLFGKIGEYLKAEAFNPQYISAVQTGFMALYATILMPAILRLTGLGRAAH